MNNKEQGFSLLEVLMAVIILSIGLLGFARAELIATRHNQAAYLQSLAQVQINSLAEQLRACGSHNPSCEISQITHWKNEVANFLPGAKAEITANNPDYVITLHWRATPGSNKASTATATAHIAL